MYFLSMGRKPCLTLGDEHTFACEACAPYDGRTGEWKTLHSEEFYNSHTSKILFH